MPLLFSGDTVLDNGRAILAAWRLHCLTCIYKKSCSKKQPFL